MKMKRICATVSALALATSMLAACGDSSSSSSKKEEATTTTTTTAATTTTTAATTEAAAESAADATASGAEAAGNSDYTPVNDFEGYDAFLMFGDASWLWGNWEGQGYADRTQAFGVDADVTGDGEYTVSITNASMAYNDPLEGLNPQVALDGDVCTPAAGTVVFCVDIIGICDGTTDAKGEPLKKNSLNDGDDANTNKETKGKYTGQEIKCEVTSIKQDGKDVEFDPSKIVYGNIEDSNNCYRMEIYNDYGDTAKDAPIDKNAIAFSDSLEVTFTISGLSE